MRAAVGEGEEAFGAVEGEGGGGEGGGGGFGGRRRWEDGFPEEEAEPGFESGELEGGEGGEGEGEGGDALWSVSYLLGS